MSFYLWRNISPSSYYVSSCCKRPSHLQDLQVAACTRNTTSWVGSLWKLSALQMYNPTPPTVSIGLYICTRKGKERKEVPNRRPINLERKLGPLAPITSFKACLCFNDTGWVHKLHGMGMGGVSCHFAVRHRPFLSLSYDKTIFNKTLDNG